MIGTHVYRSIPASYCYWYQLLVLLYSIQGSTNLQTSLINRHWCDIQLFAPLFPTVQCAAHVTHHRAAHSAAPDGSPAICSPEPQINKPSPSSPPSPPSYYELTHHHHHLPATNTTTLPWADPPPLPYHELTHHHHLTMSWPTTATCASSCGGQQPGARWVVACLTPLQLLVHVAAVSSDWIA